MTFVEVKYRKQNSMVNPFESVTLSKQKKIINTAKKYLYENEIKENDYFFRFDVIGITGNSNNIEHYENVFFIQ